MRVWLHMENKIFRKTISVDRVKYGFDPKMVLHFYFHYKPFPSQTRKKRDREREKEEIIELTPLTPILSLTSPPITELTHSHRAQPLDPLPHGSPITVSFLSPVDFFLSSTAFVYGFDSFTPPIHTPHLRSTQLRHHLTSPHQFA